MKHSKDFTEPGEQLEKLDKMDSDELVDRLNWCIDKELGEGDIHTSEEIDSNIAKIIEAAANAEKRSGNVRRFRSVRKLIYIAAAIIVIISLVSILTVGSEHNFDIKNGIVTFFKDTVTIKFYSSEDEKNRLTISELETDLREHGFDDIKFPGYFYDSEWKAENIVYTEESISKLVTFDIESIQEHYSISIISHDYPDYSKDTKMLGVENIETIQQGNIYLYLFDHGKGRFELIYFINNCEYAIHSNHSYEKMKEIAKTLG